MLKYIRVFLGVLSIVAVTLLFVDFTGTARSLWPWMAEIQLVPAILSANLIAIAIVVGATLLFGRIYCSVICPLGVMQDVAIWLRSRVGSSRNRKWRFRFCRPRTRVRLVFFSAFVALFILGFSQMLSASIAGLIEPYSAYGRIATQIFAPAYYGVNNLLAAWSETQIDNYTFYRVAAAVSVPVLVVAIVTLVAVLSFAWSSGRDYCNTVCPVGTFLGLLSNHSLLRPVIDTDLCVQCGKCARRCKASCIDSKNHAIDYSRCVACMDCINACSEKAISYSWHRRKPSVANQSSQSAVDNSRRGFLLGAGFVAAALTSRALAKSADVGLTPLKDRKDSIRATPIVPPGAMGISHLRDHCTGCQLCVQACQSAIIKPSLRLDSFMQPQLVFTSGYCALDCTACTDACPTNAIAPVSVAEKSSLKIGTAVINYDACLSAQGDECGTCERHCPTAALRLVERESDGFLIPVVDEEACIGCGACEYFCPVGTVASMKEDSSAIHVEGINRHRQI